MRVTSDAAPTVGTGIAANADAAAVTVAATAPEREGLTAAILLPPPLVATRCRVGLHASRTEVGAMLNPVIPRPLTEGAGESHSKEKLNSKRLERNKVKTYREANGMTLKARPGVDGTARHGALLGYDPCPLTLAGDGVIPTGSCLAYGSP